MTNLVTLWKNAKSELEAAGVDSPTIDARILLLDALKISRTDLLNDPYREVAKADEDKLNAFLARRKTREPVAHIIGKKAFWKLEFASDARALVPRPETEVIVDYVVKTNGEDEKRVLDIGTGTGAIILSLLAERHQWKGVATDISKDALELAQINANMHGLENRVEFLNTNWVDGVTGEFDIVVSNPPYIPSHVIPTLDTDVKDYDPHLALDGGHDGLEPYRIIFAALPNLLKQGGVFAFEFGIGQAKEILEIAQNSSYFTELAIIKDLSDIERVIIGKKQ